MSGTSTVYDVRVKYHLDDKASTGVNQIANRTDRAAKSAMSLKTALAAVGGVALLKGAKSAFLDFNSEIDQMKIGLTAVMQMQLKMPFEKARIEADKLFKVFQELAKKSPATTKDFMEMGNAIAPVVAMMGGGPDKIAKLAQGGVLAGQAFGERADIVALDIKQMLAGTVNSKDRIAQQLIASRGIKQDDFNAMDGAKRASLTESMLQDPALLKAADQMGASFKGQVSTFKDQLQMALGKVGRPLMESLTAEVKKWNTWIEQHPATIAKISKDLSGMLTGAFTFIKDTATFLADNKETIMAIGKVFLIFKGTQMATAALSGVVKGINDFASTLKNGAAQMGAGIGAAGSGGLLGTIGKFGSGLLAVLPGLTAFTAALFGAGRWIMDNVMNKNSNTLDAKKGQKVEDLNNALFDIKEKTSRLSVLNSGQRTAEQEEERANLIKQLSDPAIIGPVLRQLDKVSGGKFAAMDPSEFEKRGIIDFNRRNQYGVNTATNSPNEFAAKQLTGAHFDQLTKSQIDMLHEANKTLLVLHENMSIFERRAIFASAFDAKYQPEGPKDLGWNSGASKPEVNVTIHKVEVASEDPDRFVFGMVDMAQNAIKHATQSQHTTPGGF